VPTPAADHEDFDERGPEDDDGLLDSDSDSDFDPDSDLDDEEDGDEEAPRRAPWHFKILAVGTVIYLGYRTYQGIGWLVHHV
jgi:hypothetical protein